MGRIKLSRIPVRSLRSTVLLLYTTRARAWRGKSDLRYADHQSGRGLSMPCPVEPCTWLRPERSLWNVLPKKLLRHNHQQPPHIRNHQTTASMSIQLAIMHDTIDSTKEGDGGEMKRRCSRVTWQLELALRAAVFWYLKAKPELKKSSIPVPSSIAFPGAKADSASVSAHLSNRVYIEPISA